MSWYLAHSTYTADAWRALLESREDRRGAVAAAAEAAGCTMKHFWFALDEPHSYVIFEGDLLSMAAFEVAVLASGSVTHIEVHPLVTVEEMLEVFERAVKVEFRTPESVS